MANMQKKESTEDYLERILMLSQKNNVVRSIDIANDMFFSKPSVSIAMKKLKEENYITIDNNGYIYLTEKGYACASKIYERHNIIAESLMALGVDKETAFNDSCKIEHDISDITFAKIKDHYLSKINKEQ